MKQDKCPKCGAPWLYDMDGEAEPEWWTNPAIHRNAECDYAAGLRERAERAEAERDEARGLCEKITHRSWSEVAEMFGRPTP